MLKILSIKPEPPGSGSVIARFDIELSDDLRLFGLRLDGEPELDQSADGLGAAGHVVLLRGPCIDLGYKSI